jgi:hypothetical protein
MADERNGAMTDDELAALWATPASLTQLTATTGLSRGALVGRAFRLRQAGDLRFAEKVRPAPQTPRPPSVAKPIVVKPRFLEDLDWNACRFPVGEVNGRHTFCGRPALSRKPYCEACTERLTASRSSISRPFLPRAPGPPR